MVENKTLIKKGGLLRYMSTNIQLKDDEKIIKEGKANYHAGAVNSQGGSLILTNKRLVFKAHKINVGKKAHEIKIKQIKGLDTHNNFFIIPTGLTVETKTNEIHKFTTWGRQKWIKNVKKAMTASESVCSIQREDKRTIVSEKKEINKREKDNMKEDKANIEKNKLDSSVIKPKVSADETQGRVSKNFQDEEKEIEIDRESVKNEEVNNESDKEGNLHSQENQSMSGGVVQFISDEFDRSFKRDMKKPILFFLAINLLVIISMTIASLGATVLIAPIAFILITVGSFIFSLSAKKMAIKAYNIDVLSNSNVSDTNKEKLFELIKTLSKKVNLGYVPDVGVYPSDDANAFALWSKKKEALIAFSDKLIENMDNEEIAAVAAHEVAHLANGDAITSIVLRGTIYSIVFLVSLPINFFMLFMEASNRDTYRKKGGYLSYIIIDGIFKLIRAFINFVLVIFGSLFEKWFSRNREFKADKLAAELTSSKSMSKALQKLEKIFNEEQEEMTEKQEVFAAFKINNKKAIFDIFSTHPSIDRRVGALRNER